MGTRRSRAAFASSLPPERLYARIAELEQRVVLLEARVRRVAAQSALGEPPLPKGAKADRPRPRCPGCLLELPRGPRGERCVWCGFFFEAADRAAR